MSMPERSARFHTLARRAMTLADLPPRNTRRWVASRKAAVVAAVRERLLTETEACDLYGLSPEELASWRDALNQHGVGALRATRVQLYRDA